MTGLLILIGKFLGFLGRIFGRGSALPGKILLDLDKNMLKRFTYPDQIIFITGTNGKTSLTSYISEALEKSGKKVVTNHTGANIERGIVTSLVNASSLGGDLDCDYLVLEVDEGNFKPISKKIKPDYFLINNLFKDQVDRFESPLALAKRLLEDIDSSTILVLNGNDPLVHYIGDSVENDKIYFGLEEKREDPSFDEACPKCGAGLVYDKRLYDHMGSYTCSCGFKTPQLDYYPTSIDELEGTLVYDGHRFTNSNKTIYALANTMAAISLLDKLGVDYEEMDKVFGSKLERVGRMEKVEFNGQESFLNLVKNPSGTNLTIDILSREEEAFNLFISMNNYLGDGVDPSWIREIEFEKLNDKNIENIYISGTVAGLVKEVIEEKTSFKPLVEKDNSKIVGLLKEEGLKTYFLANYTALNDVRNLII